MFFLYVTSKRDACWSPSCPYDGGAQDVYSYPLYQLMLKHRPVRWVCVVVLCWWLVAPSIFEIPEGNLMFEWSVLLHVGLVNISFTKLWIFPIFGIKVHSCRSALWAQNSSLPSWLQLHIALFIWHWIHMFMYM